MKFSLILFGLLQMLRLTALFRPAFRARLKEKNFIFQGNLKKAIEETISLLRQANHQ